LGGFLNGRVQSAHRQKQKYPQAKNPENFPENSLTDFEWLCIGEGADD
jgi:hypothetical protein